MSCPICEHKENIIFEDNTILAYAAEKPAAAGHIIVTTKQHYPIIEKIPDELFGNVFNIANTLSTTVFEKLGAQGTNIIIQNGVAAGQHLPHTIVHIIPRRENDGLQLQWQPQQLSEDDMSTAELQLQEATKNIGVVTKEKKEVIDVKEPEEVKDNYQTKHLRRIP
jgi:histidine triad (HIT) family protein